MPKKSLLFIAGMTCAALVCAQLACGRGGREEASGGTPGPSANSGNPSPPSTSGPPSLMLITIDTWRWDYIGVSGAGKVATPVLDGLAREGIYEREAETPYPLTLPAHSTLLTGLLPMNHRVMYNVGYALPPDIPTLTGAFDAKGYGTAAFISCLTLDRRYGLNRDFSVYDQGGIGEDLGHGEPVSTRDGELTTGVALDHLRTQPPGKPQFIWVHYFDLHAPYRARPAYDARYPGDQYAAQAAFVDDQVGALLAFLRSDTTRNWRLLIVGDHGEGLGDREEMSHGLGLYRSTLSVPLIIWPRPDRPLPHEKPWRLEDLDPTVREWFGLPGPRGVDGESLFSPGSKERWLPSVTLLPPFRYGVNPCTAVRRGSLMYIKHAIEELYDLAADPDEERDLSRDGRHRADLEALRGCCDRALPADKLQLATTPNASSSGTELDALRGLGYLGGFTLSYADLQRANIREVMADDMRLKMAQLAFSRSPEDPKPLMQAYKAILARYPKAAVYYQEYGNLLLKQKDAGGAAKAFETAIKLDPQDRMSMVNLGIAYLMMGNADRAKIALEAALAQREDDAFAHKNLGVLYSRYLHEPAKAVPHFERYLELAPGAADRQAVRQYILQAGGSAGAN